MFAANFKMCKPVTGLFNAYDTENKYSNELQENHSIDPENKIWFLIRKSKDVSYNQNMQ